MLGLLSVRTAAPSPWGGGSGWGWCLSGLHVPNNAVEERGCSQLAGVSAQIRAAGGFSTDPLPHTEPIEGPTSCSCEGLSGDAELGEGVPSGRGEAVRLLFWTGVAPSGDRGLWGGVLGTGFIREGLST